MKFATLRYADKLRTIAEWARDNTSLPVVAVEESPDGSVTLRCGHLVDTFAPSFSAGLPFQRIRQLWNRLLIEEFDRAERDFHEHLRGA